MSIIQKLEKMLSLAVCLLDLFLSGLCRGFDGRPGIALGIYSTFGSGFYLLANRYFYIALIMLVYFIVKFAKQNTVLRLIFLGLLAVVVSQYWVVYLQKALLLENMAGATNVILDTIPIDYVGFLLVATLIVFETVATVMSYFNSDSANENNL